MEAEHKEIKLWRHAEMFGARLRFLLACPHFGTGFSSLFLFFFVSMISYRISSIQIAPRIPKLIIVTDFISYLFISSSFEGALMLIWRAIASEVWALFAYLFFLTRNDLFVYFIRSFPFLSRNWSESAQEQSSKIRFVDRVAFRRVLKSALGWFVCESWLLLGSYFVVGNE